MRLSVSRSEMIDCLWAAVPILSDNGERAVLFKLSLFQPLLSNHAVLLSQ